MKALFVTRRPCTNTKPTKMLVTDGDHHMTMNMLDYEALGTCEHDRARFAMARFIKIRWTLFTAEHKNWDIVLGWSKDGYVGVVVIHPDANTPMSDLSHAH